MDDTHYAVCHLWMSIVSFVFVLFFLSKIKMLAHSAVWQYNYVHLHMSATHIAKLGEL